MNWPVPILEGYILFEVSSSLIIWSDRLISTRKCQVFSCSICFFIEESSLLLAAQPVSLCGYPSHAAVLHSLSWVCASGMAFDGISFSWGRWVPLLSSWGSSAVRLLSQGFRCVLVLLLAYGLFLVGVCSCLAAARFFFLYTSIVPRPVEFVKWPGAATRFTQILPRGRLEWGVPACRSAPAWWRFGMCGIWCGWWCVEQRWIKMTCITQQYAAIRTYLPFAPS